MTDVEIVKKKEKAITMSPHTATTLCRECVVAVWGLTMIPIIYIRTRRRSLLRRGRGVKGRNLDPGLRATCVLVAKRHLDVATLARHQREVVI